MNMQLPATNTWRGRFGTRVYAGLGLAAALFVVVIALLFGSIMRLIDASRWVTHSYQVLETLDRVQDVFTDAQSAERGYVATCNLALLAPFHTDLPRLYGDIATLRWLVSDNPAQRGRADLVSAQVSEQVARMSTMVAATQRNDAPTAKAILQSAPNLRGIRAVSVAIETMTDAERGLLKNRAADVNRFTVLAVSAAVVGVAGCLTMLWLVLGLVKRETRRREEGERSLIDSNARLSRSLTALTRHHDAARSIAELGELLQICRNGDEALEIAARHIARLLPEASGTIAQFAESRSALETAQHLGGDAPFADHFAAEQCWALRSGRPHAYGEGSNGPVCGHAQAAGGTFLCLPLTAQSEARGLLSLHCAKADAFDSATRRTVQTIAEQLSLALANLRLQETLRLQSTRDPLTVLFNRRYMDEALVSELARARRHGHPVAVAMVDIDHFKRFNDANGHDGGDALLAAFARLASEHARAEDVVCRYGGEEFAIILPGAPLSIAVERIDLLRRAAGRMHVSHNGSPLPAVTLSAGVAVFPDHGDSGAALLQVADTALYQAKGSGRDRVVAAPTAEVLRGLLTVGRARSA